MNKPTLINGAEYGMKMPCFVLTVLDTNPLFDTEIIDKVSVHFDRWFGQNVPWCISIQRTSAGAERFVAAYQPAQKTIVVSPKMLFYNRTGDINDASLSVAVATARACCMIPLTHIKPVGQVNKSASQESCEESKSISSDVLDAAVLAESHLGIKPMRFNFKEKFTLGDNTLSVMALLAELS